MGRRRSAAAALGAVALLLSALAACGDGSDDPAARPATLPPPAEPGTAPGPTATPAGSVVDLPDGVAEGTVVDPGTGTLAVALRKPAQLALFDTSSREVRVVPAPGNARHLYLAAPGGPLIVPGEQTREVTEVALPSGMLGRRIAVGRVPHDAVRVGDTLFVVAEFSARVDVVRAGRLIRSLPGPAQPGGIAAAAGRVAAVDVRGNRLYVWDAETLDRVADLPAGEGPSHIRPLGDGRVAVADTRGNAVIEFDLRGEPGEVVRVAVPGRAYGLATDPERGLAYVTMADTNRVIELQVGSDGRLRAGAILPTVRQANSVAVDPVSGTVYVIGSNPPAIQVIPGSAFDGG